MLVQPGSLAGSTTPKEELAVGEAATGAARPTAGEDDVAARRPFRSRLADFVVLQTVLVLSWVTWIVPWPVWHAAAFGIGSLAMGFQWRRVVLTNVRHARAGMPTPLLVAWYLGTQQIATHCRTVIVTLRGGARRPNPSDRLTVEGLEHLRPLLGERGVIIVAPHAGPYPSMGLMSIRWLREQGFTGELAIVARLFRPFRSGALMEWFIDHFARAEVSIISVDEKPARMGRRLRQVLAEKGIVVLLVDEPTRTPSAAIPFFDSAIMMPLGPARLARATGAALVPCIATFGRGGRVTLTIAAPIEPEADPEATLRRVAGTLQEMIGRHLDQWAMLTPVWAGPPATALPPPPPGHAYADLHLHTPGSDGLCAVDDWVAAASPAGISVVAITDHDHLETIRGWISAGGGERSRVLPGVELTARGRAVHLGVLFPAALPETLPKPGRPLPELIRWARGIDGGVVVLVHPLPVIWRRQLRGLARRGLLPDAIETRFPLVGWRSPMLERAARDYGLAALGGSDGHMVPDQLGQHATLFPGTTADDLVAAIRAGTTAAVTRPATPRVPAAGYAWQAVYSWLLPFAGLPAVSRLRARALTRARRAAWRGGAVPPATGAAGEDAEDGVAPPVPPIGPLVASMIGGEQVAAPASR